MRFNVRYIPKGGNQPTDTIVNGADDRAVGWAFVQRGDQLLSIEPVRDPAVARAAVARPSATTPMKRPAKPASGWVAYSLVAILVIVGIAVPVKNLGWLGEQERAVAQSLAELDRMESKVTESKQMGLYRPSYDAVYLAPRRRNLADATKATYPPLAWCAFGVAMLCSALLVAHRHRVGVQRWESWSRNNNRTGGGGGGGAALA